VSDRSAGHRLTRSIRVAGVSLLLSVALLVMAACSGGGGGSSGGFGTEGTGFKVNVIGVLVSREGRGLEGAMVSTEDAATTTDGAGAFALETTAEADESIVLEIRDDQLDTSVVLNPIAEEPETGVRVRLEADPASGQVRLTEQELIRAAVAEDERRDRTDDTVEEIRETNEANRQPGSGGSSVRDDAAFDPDEVDL